MLDGSHEHFAIPLINMYYIIYIWYMCVCKYLQIDTYTWTSIHHPLGFKLAPQLEGAGYECVSLPTPKVPVRLFFSTYQDLLDAVKLVFEFYLQF